MNVVAAIGHEFLNWDLGLLKAYIIEKNLSKLLGLSILLLLFVVFEERVELMMKKADNSPRLQMILVSLLLISIGVLGVLGKEEFIYFQF